MSPTHGVTPAPFVVRAPSGAPETAVVVEIPHAGLFVDAPTMAFTVAPARSVGRDADLYVDEVFSAAHTLGATVLVAQWSRYVVDLNRAATDYDGLSVEGGGAENRPRGLVWRLSTEGDPVLARRLSRPELERRMRTLYEPYHQRLAELLADKRARFGHAILLCAHSMPSTGRRGHVDVGRGRADVVPGTRGRTTAGSAVIDVVDRAARDAGMTVTHDDPYQGGFSTGYYGKPDAGVHAVQIELARRLYMDEDALTLAPDGLARTRALAASVVERLGAVPPAAAKKGL